MSHTFQGWNDSQTDFWCNACIQGFHIAVVDMEISITSWGYLQFMENQTYPAVNAQMTRIMIQDRARSFVLA